MSKVLASPRAHVIFDFDLTLVAAESVQQVLALTLAGRVDAEARMERFAAVAANIATGKTSAVDLALLVRALAGLRHDHIRTYVDAMRSQLDPQIRTMMQTLAACGVDIHVLSSGYGEWIVPLGSAWGIQPRNITANRLMWIGRRAVCVAPSPLHGQSGKSTVIAQWRRRGRLMAPVVMVGDGAADYRAYQDGQADGFVSADYYTDRPLTLEPGNIARASDPAELAPCIEAVLDRLGIDLRLP